MAKYPTILSRTIPHDANLNHLLATSRKKAFLRVLHCNRVRKAQLWTPPAFNKLLRKKALDRIVVDPKHTIQPILMLPRRYNLANWRACMLYLNG